MKIWGDIPKILGVYNKQKNVRKVDKAASISSKKDVVSISGNAKDYQTIMKALSQTPDVRQDKVSELMQKYESGSYNIDGKEIADKVIKSLFDKKV